MKKILTLAVAFHALTLGSLYAEDQPAADPVVTETPAAPEAPSAAAPAEMAAPAVEPAVVEAPTTVEQAVPVTGAVDTAADNLEFVSGEITAMDEAAKTVTVKMYGEAAENEADKMLTVTVDASTDITDGEQDRELKSLNAGTEVDVEYDPATKKATYIFVY
jgi:hypothetical protein